MKRIPIGISDFKEIIEDDYYYVDKTLLIEELLSQGGKVVLMTRPRRFGKTLNLSMLRYFFERSEIDNSYLFQNTAIWQRINYQKIVGTYPVIFLTFKDIKENSWERAQEKIFELIGQEFTRHQKILFPNLSEFEKKQYLAIIEKRATYVEYSNSLLFLSNKLFQHYNKRSIILIDEYDTPINSGYINSYYKDSIDFFRGFFTAGLKDNEFLSRGFVTGILRAAKEGIFSGINNLDIATVLQNLCSDKFGFTNSEVTQLLQEYKLSDKSSEIKNWYNSYRCGQTLVYNPWSILQSVKEQGVLKPYWVNTSSNDLVKQIIALSDVSVKSDFEQLFLDKTIVKKIDEGLIFPGIEKNELAVWSLLLFSGYLTFNKLEIIEGDTICYLIIPNKEIKVLFKNLIQDIFSQSLSSQKIVNLQKTLIEGDYLTLTELLQDFVISTISYYDLPTNEPEKSYHLFVLGLLVTLSDRYQIKSNRESGYGRYDIVLIPINKLDPGIIIEFKKVSQVRNETLEIAAQNALAQIQNMKYAQDLIAIGVTKIIEYGIAFEGKKVLVKIA